MKQRRKSKIGQLKSRTLIICVTLTMILSQISLQSFIHAESDFAVITKSEIVGSGQKISVTNVKDNIQKITLMDEGTVIETKDVSENLMFDVYSNGDYVLIGYDEQNNNLGEQTVTIDGFVDMEVSEDPMTHQITIISRNKDTYQIKVSGTVKKILNTSEIRRGVHQTVFNADINGYYTFTAVDKEDKTLKKVSLNITDIPKVSDTKDIILSEESDLKQIVLNPEGSFILDKDIKVTGNLLKDVIFKGVLNGNGHVISGSERLFHTLDHATVKNIVVKGQLAESSSHSIIENTGYYIEGKNKEEDYAVVLNGKETEIRNSFVLINAEGKKIAGFVLNGTANIQNSYVSGYMNGIEVYGFGKETHIENSYISASLTGEKRILFSEGKRKDCFYDAQINDIEDEEAQPYLTSEMISGTLNNDAFAETEGSYPQIRTDTEFKEQALDIIRLSLMNVMSDCNLSAVTDTVSVPEQENSDIEWNRNLTRTMSQNSEMNGEIAASLGDMKNRFILRTAPASVSVSAGKPTTSTETEITYPVVMGKYYIVRKSSEAAPVSPVTHKAAIENGWKRMYWDGSYTLSGLEWNTEYSVYETDLSSVTVSSTIKTEHGKNKGQLILTGTYDIGNTMTATLSDTNTMKGTLYWESADTSDAETWTELKATVMNDTKSTDTYAVTDALSGKYLRVRFETDEKSGYTGTLQDISAHSVKVEISKIEIVNSQPRTAGQYTLTDKLSIRISPDKLNEATYTWYQEGKSEAIGTGMNYTIKGSDVGKRLYVKATAKADGELTGTKESVHTTEVQAIQCTRPNASTMLTEIISDDITVKVKISTSDGLYRIGIQKEGSSAITEHGVLLRGGSDTTITGLDPNTSYKLYIKAIGEDGYTDSEWSSDNKELTTDKRHVQGDIKIDGDLIYGKTLTVKITNTPAEQTGEVNWYRLDKDGSRNEATKQSGNAYELKKEDVDQKIEVVYSGTGTYAGEISFVSDEISRAEKAAPTQNLSFSSHKDTTITVKMPTNITNEKYIIGRSTMENGVPVEEVNDKAEVKILSAGEEFEITGLERDTTYYFSIRYAQSDTHQKSDWTAQNIIASQKTDKKEFKGIITFNYPTSDLLRGQTLTAILGPEDSGFNYQGEWTWTKIADDGKETPITNYTLAENRGSTSYVIPDNEAYGTAYKVTFKATVGYEGSATPAISAPVKEKQKSRYTKPNADDIVMETIDDMSFKVRMSEGEGQYQFEYKKSDTNVLDSLSGWFNVNVLGDSTDGFIPVGNPVNSNVDVVVDGLDRNTKYTVRVKRVADNEGLESEYTNSESEASKTVTTAKTQITGYITISGTARFNEELTASYHASTYASQGNGSDTDGTWQWYRGSEKISGSTSAKYTITTADIGKTLKAVYTMPTMHAFTGSVEELTTTVSKALPDLLQSGGPKLGFNSEKEDSSGNKILVLDSLPYMEQYGYYCVQKKGISEPSYPTTDELKNWNKVNGNTFEISRDYNGALLETNTAYVVYYLAPENTQYEKTAMKQLEHTMGTKQQKGNISIAGNYVVGKTLTATLSNTNNSKGTWKWYYSNNAYNGTTVITSPSLDSEDKWTEITSGYSPMSNSAVSQLNITEELFGRYIRVVFEADLEQGYSGKVMNPVNNDGFVKKIYEETVTLTSSTTDGNGNPKAYAGTTLTGTVNNNAETSLSNRTTVRFKIGSTYADGTVNGNKFTYTIPSSNSLTDGAEITAEVSSPKTIGLYVDKNLNTMTNIVMSSKGSTSTFFTYVQGIPISNENNLIDFIQAKGMYTDRSGKFVVTKDLDVSNFSQAWPTTTFSGIMDGDFHKIRGLKTPLINKMEGKSNNNKAEIRNCIFTNAIIDGGAGQQVAIVVGQTTMYTKIHRVLVASSTVNGENRALIVGVGGTDTRDWDLEMRRSNIVEETVAVSAKLNGAKGSSGAFAGFAPNTYFRNNYAVNAEVLGGYNTNRGGFLGAGHRGGKDSMVNNYFAGDATNAVGGILGLLDGSSSEGVYMNNYYDSTVIGKLTGGNDYRHGTGLSTSEMIGSNLESSFGNDGTWYYSEGYYPRLSWMKENPIATLYAATRGAFTSVDGKTSKDDMFNGKVKGVIQLPEELMGEGFSAKIKDGDYNGKWDEEHKTLTVYTNGSVDLEVTYTDKDTGATASNTFTFSGNYGNYDNDGFIDDGYLAFYNSYVTSNGDISELKDAPYIGMDLWAYSSYADYDGNTYQWYRKRRGAVKAEKIEGATNWEYKVTKEDLGCQLTCFVTQKDEPRQRYLGQFAKYTQSVINEDFDNVKVSVSSPTDSSMKVNVLNGSSAYKYEYAYERADANGKIMVDGTYTSAQTITINNLARNKRYNFYVRVAAGDGYDAGKWSPAVTLSTLRTEVSGSINLGKAINNGTDLSMSIDKINGQAGIWKLERLNATTDAVESEITAGFSSADNPTSYKLQAADVNKKIRVTFTGTGDYQGSVTATTEIIKKSSTPAPSGAIVSTGGTDTSLIVKTPNVTGNIDMGYAESASASIHMIKENIVSGTAIQVSGLSRNSEYYFFYRISETEGTEASPWSAYTMIKTKRTDVQDSISVTGTAKTDETIKFKLNDSGLPAGIWSLSSVKDGKETTVSPSHYTVNTSENSISYRIQPKDALGTLKATFIGTGDYQGTVIKDSGVVANASQDNSSDMPTKLNVTEVSDHSMKVSAADGTANYQFAYRKNGAGTWTQVNASVTAGTVVSLEGLERNTSYILAVRKSAKTGYEASEYKQMQTASTIKTKLNGLVDYVKIDENNQETAPKIGVAEVSQTYKATYHKGSYSQTAADDSAGHWQWYAGDTPIRGADAATYTVAPMNGSPEISVRYIANDASDFSGEVIGRVGTLTKPLYDAPASLPTVTALEEDGDMRSQLKITNDGDINAVYYYVQKASNQKVPNRIYASDADKNSQGDGKWFKALADVTLTLDANTDYVVYLARLEDGSHQASGVIPQRAVRTKKEDLSNITAATIEEANADIWKVEEPKEIRLSNHGEAPTGIWQYYVSLDKTKNDSWINITAQIRADDTSKGGYTATTFSVPVKYNGYYVKAVFSGRGSYEGSQTYISDQALIGTQIRGYAEITTGDTSEVLVPIEVNYVYAKENGVEIVDEKSGQWTWYRVKDGTETQIRNENGEPYGRTGRSDSYTPGKEDVGAKIYAQYSSARNGIYSGSVKTGQLSAVERASQNIPDAPVIKQVRGITVQVNLPANYRKDGTTIPETVLKYRIKGTENWTSNAEGESWIGKGADKLKANTVYEVSAMYKGTGEYLPSHDSAVTEVKTGSIPLEEKNLSITQNDILEAGQALTAIYSGDGYDEGYFSVERSDGTVIKANETGTKTGTSIALTYESTAADIGQHIVVRYTAKADATNYGGSVEKSSSEVVKAKNTAAAVKPDMETELDTNLYVTNVQTTQEYILLKAGEDISQKAESDWTPLDADNTGRYEFTHLERKTSYVLYTRLAETEIYTAGNPTGSSVITTPAYNDAGSMEVLNKNDGSAAKNESADITFPHSLKQGKMEIHDLNFKRNNASVTLQPVRMFADESGKATKTVTEKGSEWANENYGLLVKVYDASGNLIDSGEKGDSLNVTNAASIRVEVYRANAVSDGGPYTWSLTLKDSEGETAVIQGEAEMITQLNSLSPIRIDLNLEEQQIKQSTNDAKVSNNLNYMPVTLGVDQKVVKGKGMPSLMGNMNIGLGQIQNDEAYLKLSSDGSDYNRNTGVWFTTDGESKIQSVYDLGYKGSGSFYISGAVSDKQNWPWKSESERKVEQAYQISFTTAISKNDMKHYEYKAKK